MILESPPKTKHLKPLNNIITGTDSIMNKIEIYTSTFCLYCHAAKRLLKKRGLEFEEINLGREPGLRNTLIERYNWRTVPLIKINGKMIGGYRELVGLHKSGELDRLLDNTAV